MCGVLVCGCVAWGVSGLQPLKSSKSSDPYYFKAIIGFGKNHHMMDFHIEINLMVSFIIHAHKAHTDTHERARATHIRAQARPQVHTTCYKHDLTAVEI